MYATMKAIIKLQREFILTQDEDRLVPMRLADVADITHLDISTVSRAKNSKYALIDGTIYPLSVFFLRSRSNAAGEELKKNVIEQLLKGFIDSEDADAPYSDRQLEEMLKEKGHNISRRTIAKYREAMGIPSSQDRKR